MTSHARALSGGSVTTRNVGGALRAATVLLLALMLGPAAVRADQQEPADSAVLIRNVTIVDAGGVQPARDVTLRGELIESVEATDDSTFEGRTIDGEGRYLIPGLVDAHVHVGGSSREEAGALLAWAVQGGVTSIRDMAGDARSLAGIDEALISGELTGPSLYYAGLMAGPAFMSDPRLEAATRGYDAGEAPFMIPLTEDTDLIRAVAMIKGAGATGVKLYAALEPALVEAATVEAHRVGLRVWAHSAVFPAKPLEVIDAGVDGVSHAPYLIWDAEPPTPDFTLRAQGDFDAVPADGPQMARVIEAMVRNGTVLDPTLFVFHRMAERNPDDAQAAQRIAWGADFTRLAREAGVTIAAGTDGLGEPLAGALPNVHEELALLVELAGFTPLEALAAGTIGGAEAIGIEADVGTVEAGKVADLVLLAEDPAASIGNTRRIVHVLRRGRLIR